MVWRDYLGTIQLRQPVKNVCFSIYNVQVNSVIESPVSRPYNLCRLIHILEKGEQYYNLI